MLAHERPGGAGVVEVDVGEEEVSEVADLHSAGAQRAAQRGQAARRAAVEERQAVVGLHEICGDATQIAAVEEVERLGRHVPDAISG